MEFISFDSWQQNGSGRINNGVWEYTPQTDQPSEVTLSKKGLKPGKFKLVVLSQGGSIHIDYTLWGDEDRLKIEGFRNFNPTGGDKEEEFETEIDYYQCDKVDIVLTIQLYATGSTARVSLFALDDDDDNGGGGDDSGEVESVDKLRIGMKRPDALMFSKGLMEDAFEFDFQKDWIINPDNAEGITVEGGKITVKKVKPNTWFIRSNYGFSTDAQRNEKFFEKLFTLSGLNALAGYISGVPVGGYSAYGVVISPCNNNGGFFSESYPWEMNIAGGSFKYGPQGALNYGYTLDGERALYNYNVPNTRPNSWDGGCYEVGFAFYTSHETLSDGYLELPTPFTIESFNDAAFDPAGREGWEAALGGVIVYRKVKTFENCLMEYDLAFEEKGKYTTAIQGVTPDIIESEWQRTNNIAGSAIAYVVTERFYSDQYKHIRFPVPANFKELLKDGFPMKFWAKPFDVPTKENFWNAVIDAFLAVEVTDNNYLDHLFALSNVNAGSSEVGALVLNLNCSPKVEPYNRFAFDSVFDYSDVDKVVVNVNWGWISTIRNAFRQTRQLKSVAFVNNTNDELGCCPFQWSGAFEYSALPDFPDGLGCSNYADIGPNTQGKCQISYAFHGAVMSRIGNFKPGGTPADETFIKSFEDWTDKIFAEVSGSSFTTSNGTVGVTMLRAGAMQLKVTGLIASSVATAYIEVTGTNSKGQTMQRLMYSEIDGTYNVLFYPGHLDVKVWNGGRGDAKVEIVSGQYFGAAPSGTDRYTMLVHSYAEQAFDGWSGSEIVFNLDMRFVTPNNFANNMFNCQSLQKVQILNLNKGNWSLDGISRNGSVQGNLPNLDADSVNFMLNNVFDLRTNATDTTGREEFTQGLSSATLYLPASLQSKATSAAISAANARGWTIIFGATS